MVYIKRFSMNIGDLKAEQLEKAAGMLKAIAHPMRINILSLLEQGNSMSVTQIYEKLGIEQSTASHHLGILKNKGVLISKRKGKNTLYSLKHQLLSKIVDCIGSCSSNEG